MERRYLRKPSYPSDEAVLRSGLLDRCIRINHIGDKECVFDVDVGQATS